MTTAQRIRLGRAVVNLTQRTRRHRDRDNFPLTAGWVQRKARQLGRPVGIKEAYAIQHALIEAEIIEASGSYAQRRFGYLTGFKVALFRLGKCALRLGPSSVGTASRQGVGTGILHPLFGDPELARWLPEKLRRWREPPEWKLGWLHDQ